MFYGRRWLFCSVLHPHPIYHVRRRVQIFWWSPKPLSLYTYLRRSALCFDVTCSTQLYNLLFSMHNFRTTHFGLKRDGNLVNSILWCGICFICSRELCLWIEHIRNVFLMSIHWKWNYHYCRVCAPIHLMSQNLFSINHACQTVVDSTLAHSLVWKKDLLHLHQVMDKMITEAICWFKTIFMSVKKGTISML